MSPNMKFDFKKLLPHAIAIVAFLLVSVIYCKPALSGKVVSQSDMIQWKGMSKDAENYKERHGVYPQWTNNMFGGMPTFSIAFNSNATVAGLVPYITGFMLPVPILYFFLACLTFYFLSQVLRVNPYIGILGAFAFAFCSYDPILITAGHHTKLITIAQMPALLGAVILVYQKKYWLGGALTAWFTAGLISHSHLQMVYYFMLIALFMTVAYVIYWIRTKQIRHLLTAGVITAAAVGAGALANLVSLRPTSEYAKYTIRGGTALASAANKSHSSKVGLDTGYAFQYSYGIPETFSLLVPNIYGGETRSFDETSKLFETINEKGLPQEAAQEIMQGFPQYWGNQPFTSGPVYVGAVICFLFVLSLVILKSRHKWWLLSVSLFAIILAWGKNLPGLNTFLFEHLPLYNKFRAPTQSLVIPQLTFPVLAILALQQFLFGYQNKLVKTVTATPVTNPQTVVAPTANEDMLRWKQLLITGGVTVAVMVIILLLAQTFSYKIGNEGQLQAQLAQAVPGDPGLGRDIVNAGVADRKGLLMADFWRSLLFVALAFGLLAAVAKRKLAARWAVFGLLALSSFDLIQVGKRFLNENSFVEKEEGDVEGSLAVRNPGLIKLYNEIQQDKGLHYRVYNGASDPYQDALTSYYLRSVGGYHPAKLSLYQDLIENQLGKGNMQAFNMLDTKYLIGRDGQVQQNPGALGAAWFVKAIRYVDGPSAEMKALDSLHVQDTAVIDKTFQRQITVAPQFDSAASIQLVTYDNDLIVYNVKTATNQIAVLSEVYYPAGWKAFVDGKETPIVKANYVLRAVSIPANTKKLELKFEPEVYKSSYRITGIMNYVLVLLLLVGLFMGWRDWKKDTIIRKG